MRKDKCVICTIGTSIANGCELQNEYSSKKSTWELDTKEFEKQISMRVESLGENIHKISAEINSLERLGLTTDSKVILLATDNAAGKACANEIKKFIKNHFFLADENIDIQRIEGLQVYDADILRKEGLRNFIKTVLKYLNNDDFNYRYDIVLNPTGGYKGVIPFLTVLGMLYGKSCVYIFEHSKQLITLPPLPFSFDIDIYNRVKPALKQIYEKVAISEQEYYSHIIDYTESEKVLFSSFIEFIDGNKVTISPLAEVLLSIENCNVLPMVSENIINELKDKNDQQTLVLKRLIKNSVNPLWRMKHSKQWQKKRTDLIIIKQPNIAARLAGFIKKNTFYVAYAFSCHDGYEKDLSKYNKESANKLKYKEWEIIESKESVQSYDDLDCTGKICKQKLVQLETENRELKNILERIKKELK